MRHLSKPITFAVLVATASLWPIGANAQQEVRRYAVKFVCGKAEGRILAPGTYTTAINIQNPNHDPGSDPVVFRKKYSVARPGEQVGGTTPFIDGDKLEPGDAFEIDCPDILEQVRDFCPDGLCKGFATLEGSAELEIVAVYSVADLETDAVRSIHTKRVSDAGSCPVRVETVPAKSLLFIPPNVRGDREFDGHGPCVRFTYDLRTQDQSTTLVASYFLHAFECNSSENPQHDFTAAEGRRETIIFATPPQSRILGYNVTSHVEENHRDGDHNDIIVSFPGNEPVTTLRFVGDTSGDESGTKTGVEITTRPTQVRLEDCGPVKEDR